MSVKIRSLELENVKRVKAVTMVPTDKGLTIIGGDNAQGKTTILDAICFALGGEKYRPGNLQREGAVADPLIRLELSTGLIVERKGKNATLKVTDPSGKKAGQALLDSFVETFALDLPKFLKASSKEKGATLLQIIGVGDQLTKMEQEEQKLYNERHGIGSVADRKKKFAEEMPYFADAPEMLVSTSELLERQKEILGKNAENDRLRSQVTNLKQKLDTANEKLQRLQKEISIAKSEQEAADKEYNKAVLASQNLKDESTDQLESEMSKVEAINDRVRANLAKTKANEDAEEMTKEYNALSAAIESIRQKRLDLLSGAKMPLPELSVEAGELTYKGKKWDCSSGSEQLIVATAIVRELNPNCGFVLLNGLEAMDVKTLTKFGEWLESKDLQGIATRVSTGSECSIIIEDGKVLETEEAPAFTPGNF